MRGTRDTGARRGRHRLLGFDRVGYACIAQCSCGWSSEMVPAEDRAFLAFWRHRLARWRLLPAKA